MPKISAPSVAEHRAAKRGELIGAAEALLQASGLEAVTPRAVCERAGLARSSFYQYFPSRDDLLVAVAIAAIHRWDAELERSLAATEPGLPRLRAFIDSTMAMTADGQHAVAGALRDAELRPSRMDEAMELHEALVQPLVDVLAQLGQPEPHRAAMLAQGAISAGVRLVEHGLDQHAVADDVFALLSRGLATGHAGPDLGSDA